MLKYGIALLAFSSLSASTVQEDIQDVDKRVHWHRMHYDPIQKVLFIPFRQNPKTGIYETIKTGNPHPFFISMNEADVIEPDKED